MIGEYELYITSQFPGACLMRMFNADVYIPMFI